MFNTMTFTKVLASLAGALLIFLFAAWGAESLYSTEAGGHGEEGEHVEGFAIATGGDDEADAEPEVVVAFADVYATADAAKGEKLFSKCKACHKLEDGANGTGPSLYGVVGRPVGTEAGFAYSDPVLAHGGDWTPEELNHWLENPKSYIPGNKMTFAGLKKIEDRANLIAYLATIGG